MPVRTTYANVAAIIELDPSIVADDATLLPFSTVANELVTEWCVGRLHGPIKPEVPYTDLRLELIERWLTAHVYTTIDPRVSAESAGTVSSTYQSRVDIGFDVSHYGQMAMRLDTSGGLARLNSIIKKGLPRVQAHWLGSGHREDGGRTWCPPL